MREREELRPLVTNYLLQEARNASLGAAGEEFVLNFEQARLAVAGQEGLAAAIEQVSKTRGVHEGYDVLSFETDGRERLIEVKTTAFGPMTPFYVSANQVRRSQASSEQYHVYRLFRFRRDPRLYTLRGAIDRTFNWRPWNSWRDRHESKRRTPHTITRYRLRSLRSLRGIRRAGRAPSVPQER